MTKLQRDQRKKPRASTHVGLPTPTGEAAIWGRIIRAGWDDLSADAARSILRIKFAEEGKARMHELSVKGQEGALTESEQAEFDDYARVGRALDLIHSQARRLLKRSSPAR
jgi:hypothetical protein